VLPDLDGGRGGTVVAAGHRLRKLATEEGAVVVAADLATRMIERVPVAPAAEGGAATERVVVFRHDPERLAGALAALLGVESSK